jgi:hypothetical protein
LVADHGLIAYRNTDAFNITSEDYAADAAHQGTTTPGPEIQLLFDTPAAQGGLGMPLWRVTAVGGDEGNLAAAEAVWSPNGGMAQIYLKDQGASWQTPPSAGRIKKVASLLYREAVGHAGYSTSQLYHELAPDIGQFGQRTSNGAFGSPPAIFVRIADGGGNSFVADFRWVKDVPTNQPAPYDDIVLGTIDEFLAARTVAGNPVIWPEFAERLDEMNHKNAAGSRTGDIVVIMNAEDGYMAVNHGEDMLDGWHGGPTEGESWVPLMFNMPGPAIIPAQGKSNPAFLHQAYAQAAAELQPNGSLHVRQMGEILEEMLESVRGAAAQ